MDRSKRCVHFNGTMKNSVCEAGVAYDAFKDRDGVNRIPCWDFAGGNDSNAPPDLPKEETAYAGRVG